MYGIFTCAGGACRYRLLPLGALALLLVAWTQPLHAQESGAAGGASAAAGSTAADGADGQQAGAPGSAEAELLAGRAVAVQAYHRLLPNDYIRIVVSAGETFSYDRTVNAEGKILLPLVAEGSAESPALVVEGLTVSGVESELQQAYSEFYKSPNVDVALLEVGRAPVLLVYPAGATALRSVSNGQTLSSLLGGVLSGGLEHRYAYLVRGGHDLFRRLTRQDSGAGGSSALLPPAGAAGNGVVQLDTGMASREELRLEALAERPGVQVFEVDLAGLSRGGRLEQDVELRAGDVIFLAHAPRLATPLAGTGPKLVRILGVAQSGVYGLLPGEGLGDLLRLSGFAEWPNLDLRNVLIERHDAAGTLRRIVLNLDPAGSDLDLRSVELAHRDTVRISSYVDQVFVVGSVRTAGTFAYSPNFGVLDYLTLAGGPAPDAHLKFVKVIRPGRTVGAEVEHPAVFNVNLARDMKGEPQTGYSILQGDIIYVPPKGYEPSIRDVTSALSTVFLGVSFFDDLLNTSSGEPLPGTGSNAGSVGQ